MITMSVRDQSMRIV